MIQADKENQLSQSQIQTPYESPTKKKTKFNMPKSQEMMYKVETRNPYIFFKKPGTTGPLSDISIEHLN
jgi:hypothetical protein